MQIEFGGEQAPAVYRADRQFKSVGDNERDELKEVDQTKSFRDIAVKGIS